MSHVVMAEMVASVFEVVAGPGDIVEPTDPLVILESMKMEIRPKKPRSPTAQAIAKTMTVRATHWSWGQ